MKSIVLLAVLVFPIYGATSQYGDRDKLKNDDRNGSHRLYNTIYFLSQDNNFPLHQNFTRQPSYLGARLGIQQPWTKFRERLGFPRKLDGGDKFWVGLELGWNVYQQHLPFATYQNVYAATATEAFNFAYDYSAAFSMQYFFTHLDKRIAPYFGIGIGLAYDKFAQYYSIYSNTWNTYGWQVKPEVGLLVRMRENSSWSIKAAVHFDHASNNGNFVDYSSFYQYIPPDYYAGKFNGIENWGFQIGIVKMVKR